MVRVRSVEFEVGEVIMAEKMWEVADLDIEQLRLLQEAEQTFGPVNLIAFDSIPANVAKLNASQVECLQGLEKKLGLTVVAYQKG